MRNNFEHFDERLDRWHRESKQHNCMDLNLGAPNAIAGIDEIDRFRMFDPGTGELWFWGENFNLKTLVAELNRLRPIATKEASRPHWDPRVES